MSACGGAAEPQQTATTESSLASDNDQSADGASECKRYNLPVTLPGDSTSYNLAGWLCGSRSPNRTVLLLVHGGSYSHLYWDMPVDGHQYSFVHEAHKAGYTTFNIDRLGIGESDHPAPEALTNYSGAEVLHQVVQALKSGAVHHPFAKVVLVGHSIGTAMSMIEASTYSDADGVLGSGLIHHLNFTNFGIAASLAYPAVFDPKFAGSGLPFGYLTTVPGGREVLFYYTPSADPAVIAKDEETKQTITVGELSTIVPATLNPNTVNIHVPVASFVGEFDSLGCGDGLTCNDANVAANEAPFFASDTCLETKVITNTGHDLNLHTTVGTFYGQAIDWLDRRIGSSTTKGPKAPCQ